MTRRKNKPSPQVFASIGPQLVQPTAKPVAQITMPLLVEDAPFAFMAYGYSLERLRKAYGITRRAALELVLAGLCVAQIKRRRAA
jgi:hypothetical protein